VEVSGDFGSEGEPANNITYNVKVTANADEKAINELIYQTDKKAEIQNTLRTINTISLNRAEAVSKLK
jgi:hypothetical protein